METTSIEDEAKKREIYKKIYDEFQNWTGTLSELMEKYGMSARDLVYASDLSARIMDVAEGKMTRDDAKEWLRGFVATAYNLYKIKQTNG